MAVVRQLADTQATVGWLSANYRLAFWGRERFELFFTVHLETNGWDQHCMHNRGKESCIVALQILLCTNDVCSYFCLVGFRHISLRTEHNMPLPLATLFCQISLKTYVPERYTGKQSFQRWIVFSWLLYSRYAIKPVKKFFPLSVATVTEKCYILTVCQLVDNPFACTGRLSKVKLENLTYYI